MSIDMEFEVRIALRKHKKTQKWLAEQLGISSPYLSDILRGKRDGDKAKEHIKTIKVMLGIKD